MKTRISVEATELNEDETTWTEAGIFLDRDGEAGPDLAEQMLILNRGELRAVYDALRLYYEHGTWSTRTVEGPLPASGELCPQDRADG